MDDDRTSVGVIVVVRVLLILELHVGKAGLRDSKRSRKVGLDVAEKWSATRLDNRSDVAYACH
jgi:hypothetical protein